MLTAVEQTTRFKDILLIRAGYSRRHEIRHPLHIPAPLALKYTQTILEQTGKYHVQLVDQLASFIPREAVLDIVGRDRPELVIISIDSAASQEAVDLGRSIKELDERIFIVGVGADASEKHQQYLELDGVFDVIVRGEFEFAIKTLLEDLNAAEDVASFCAVYNRKAEQVLVEDLDCLPSLTWSYEELSQYPILYPLRFQRRVVPGYVLTSRGCPHACTFCSPSIRKSYGRKMRLRSAAKVADDVAALKARGVNVVTFEDDDFTASREHVLSICDEFIRRKLDIRWICHARIDEVTPEIMRVMKQAGCALLLFGVESGSQRVVQVLQKMPARMDWPQKAKFAFAEAKKAGIATCAMFMVGNPAETEADLKESVELSIAIDPDMIKVHNFNLYPGSADYRKYQDINTAPFTQHHYLRPRVNVSGIDPAQLRRAQVSFYRRFFFRPTFVLRHLRHYSLFYLNNWSRSFKLFREASRFLLGPA